MNNPRISKKELSLIKGSIRRIFSRSELREQAIKSTRISEYQNPDRPRVKKWCKCSKCLEMTPEYLMSVDHIQPVIPLDKAFAEMTIDETIDNLWCDPSNLQALCETCHDAKSNSEATQRAVNRKLRKLNKKD